MAAMQKLRCSHLNAHYTEHAETWNHSLTCYFHIICFLVRLMLQPLYPFTYAPHEKQISRQTVLYTSPVAFFFNAIQRNLLNRET